MERITGKEAVREIFQKYLAEYNTSDPTKEDFNEELSNLRNIIYDNLTLLETITELFDMANHDLSYVEALLWRLRIHKAHQEEIESQSLVNPED